jgi:hypothetical protein
MILKGMPQAQMSFNQCCFYQKYDCLQNIDDESSISPKIKKI